MLVAAAIPRRNAACGERRRDPVLDLALERRQRLRPQAVAPSVPEQPLSVSDTGERHRAARRRAEPASARTPVLKRAFRHVTARARHAPVRAEAGVEEELPSELGG